MFCLCRKWTAATRWPVPRVNNTSVGCAWASSAESTHTATLTTHIHPVSTSEWWLPLFNLSVAPLYPCATPCSDRVLSLSRPQTLPWCGSGWRRCLVERWGGLSPVRCLPTFCSFWMHFSSWYHHFTSSMSGLEQPSPQPFTEIWCSHMTWPLAYKTVNAWMTFLHIHIKKQNNPSSDYDLNNLATKSHF